ncbi:hypothetical protein JCM11491_003197 [Sporobolomyces phaffii]
MLGLSYDKTTMNVTLPSGGSSGIPPDLFKLLWGVGESDASLNHKLDRIQFSSGKARYLLPFPTVQPLVGRRGELPLAAHITPGLIEWVEKVGACDVLVRLVFRPLSTVVDYANPQSVALRTLTQYGQNDVLFFFPTRNKDTPARVLWSESSKLAESSPYFKTLFDSNGFSETDQKINAPTLGLDTLGTKSTATSGGGSATKASSAIVQGANQVGSKSKDAAVTMQEVANGEEDDGSNAPELEYEDSDLEDDYFFPPSPSPSIHRLVVHGVAYKTLFAYLYYLETGTIDFDPLTSLLPASYARRAPPNPATSPPTCSPKSMYRLASLYEHQALRELSYKTIKAHLDGRNALVELSSDLAADFDEIRQLAVEAVLDNWTYIKGSREMEDVKASFAAAKGSSVDERKIGLVFELLAKLRPEAT